MKKTYILNHKAPLSYSGTSMMVRGYERGSLNFLLSLLLLITLQLVPGKAMAQLLGQGSSSRHSAVILADGKIFTWGDNEVGQLGIGNYTDQATPQDITCRGSLSGKTIIRVSPGWRHSLALASDGTVHAWGYGGFGELGNGTSKIGSSVPVQVTGLTNVVEIAAGLNHSLALKNDGTVYAWGFGENGELGNSCELGINCNSSFTPVLVQGLHNVTTIAAGSRHNLAITSSGTVYAWGYGANGRLGNNENVSNSTPVQVIGLTGTTAIAAGGSHSLAISGGAVYAWGLRDLGRLGTPSDSNPRVPVMVEKLSSDGTTVAAGAHHSLALKSNGSVYAWGDGLEGQLGNGETILRTHEPLLIPTLAGVTSIAAGRMHNLAVTSGSSIYAWGYGINGELGNGTFTTSKTPVQVPDLNSLGFRPSLTSSATNNTICEGEEVTFTAGEGFVNFAFYLNNGENPVQSSASKTYRNSSLLDGDRIRVVATTSGGCTAISPEIVMTVNKLSSPLLTSSAIANTICAGEEVTFTAEEGFSNYAFFLNDAATAIQSGSSNTFTSNLSNGDKVKVIVTNTRGCSAVSTSITTIAKSLVDASITGPGTVAIGTPLAPSSSTYTLPADVDASDTYVWSVTYNEDGHEMTVQGQTNSVNPHELSITWPTDIPRVYKVKVDYGSGSCTNSSVIFVAVYDPNGGFVTGGGWINSPAGAYTPDNPNDEDVTGKANFGFVSKYKKGSSTPEGNTEFQFYAGNLNFKSNIYTKESLVVGGARAKYSGKGTVAGFPGIEFNFFVSVIDGNIDNSLGADRFRIKIWRMNAAVEDVLYDNNSAASPEQDPAAERTTISGGSIVIHEVKTLSTGPAANKLTADVRVLHKVINLQNYPNPYNDKTTLKFTADRKEAFALEVYDMKGALVKRIADGKTEPGKTYEYEFHSGKMADGIYVAKLVTSSRVHSLKMVHKQ